MDITNLNYNAADCLENKAFDFLGLPKELRLQIYEYLLKPSTIDIYSYDTPSVKSCTDDSIARTKFYAKSLETKLYPQILRTCKQILAEAHCTRFTPATLSLRPSSAGEQHPEKEHTEHLLNGTKLSRLHRLNKLEVELITTSSSKEEDIRHSAVLTRLLAGDLQAQSSRLCIREPYFEGAIKDEDDEEGAEAMRELLGSWADVLRTSTLEVLCLGEDNAPLVSWTTQDLESWEEGFIIDALGETASIGLDRCRERFEDLKRIFGPNEDE